MGRKLLWGIPAALYLIFVFWYTDLGGRLQPDEIEAFAEKLVDVGLGPEEVEHVSRFMESDTGRQFIMVNILDMNANPPHVEGAEPGENAQQLMGRYMEHMFRELFKRACHPIYAGDAVFYAMDLVGVEGMDRPERWTNVGLMRYRSRRSIMEIITNPETLGRHEFKIAALSKTIAFPVETVLNPGELRFVLAAVLLAGVGLVDLALYRRSPGPEQ